jgi:hypothetical protein
VVAFELPANPLLDEVAPTREETLGSKTGIEYGMRLVSEKQKDGEGAEATRVRGKVAYILCRSLPHHHFTRARPESHDVPVFIPHVAIRSSNEHLVLALSILSHGRRTIRRMRRVRHLGSNVWSSGWWIMYYTNEGQNEVNGECFIGTSHYSQLPQLTL